MLEKTTRLISENLARAVNRRVFLKRAGETMFAGVAALAAGHLIPTMAGATASGGSAVEGITGSPQCAPPGPYCNTGQGILSGCRGGSCYQHMVGRTIYQCRVYYQWYQAGCWTTSIGGGRYWVCCDCECGQPRVASCGCAQLSSSPVPRPDAPTKA